MKTLLLILFAVLLSSPSWGRALEGKSTKQPNFLFIVVDDMGYSDISAFGSEIKTPHIDELAKEGLRISNFYTAPTCSPARSMFLTGVDNHLNGLGAMEELIEGVLVHKYPEIKKQKGYSGHLNNNVVSIAQVLKAYNYDTYMAGKWHLGTKPEFWPIKRGFDKSFVLLQGGSTHLGRPRSYFDGYGCDIVENDKKVTNTLSDDFYTTVGFTDKLLGYMKSGENDGKPFFAYLAFTAPHDPIQTTPEHSNKYKGKYDEGYDVIRKRRYEALVKRGFFSGKDAISEKDSPKWEDLSAEEKKRRIRTMEVYAGMVDAVDEQIGRVINYLKKTGQYENTVIVFFSDNGSSSISVEDYEKEAGLKLSAYIDQSYDNIGNANSAPAVGAGWAQASMAPFRWWKNTTAEGGIRTPMIIRWGGMDKSKIGKIDTRAIGHVLDFAPTIYDLLGIQYPATYEGNKIVPMTGVSMLPFLENKSPDIHTDYIGWELHGNRSLRKGKWKLLWIPTDAKNKHWELYDLSKDVGETTDLSKQNPKVFAEMKKLYAEYAKKNKVLNISE